MVFVGQQNALTVFAKGARTHWRSAIALWAVTLCVLLASPASARTVLACPHAPPSTERHALVIANYAYQGEPDQSRRRQAMEATGTRAAQRFCDVGYKSVTILRNLQSRPALDAIAYFVQLHRGGSQIAMYMIGHGKQFSGVPHLLGTDYDIDQPATASMGLSVHAVYNRVSPLLAEQSSANLVIFIDACRDNDEGPPNEANFVPGTGTGPLYATRRIWVAYATQPGSFASSDGADGTLTTAFFSQWSAALADQTVRTPQFNNWTYVVQLAGERLAANGQQYPLVVGGWPGHAVASAGVMQYADASAPLAWLPIKAGHRLLFDRPSKFLSWDRTGSTLAPRDRKVNQGFDAAIGSSSGVPDHDAAARLWREAAQAGSSVAAHNLGVLAYYYNNDWITAKQSFDAAWTKSLAEFGQMRLIPTQTDLAHIRAKGLGDTEVDRDVALEMFRRSAEAGDPDAMAWLAHLLDDRGQFVEAEVWRVRAAAANEPSALYELALRSQHDGFGLAAHPRTAALMENAALQGDRDIQALVGSWYVRRDDCGTGLRHLNASAQNGSRAAAIELRSLQRAGACL